VIRPLLPAVAFCLLSAAAAPAICADEASLVPEAAIDLPTVRGRIDHLAADVGGGRLFIAALRSDTVEVVDVKTARRMRSLHGFSQPQGVYYASDTGRLFISSARGARIDIRDGMSLARITTVEGLGDADNIRYDAAARRVYVGHGAGALRVLDGATGETKSDIALAGHPEAFQLEAGGQRIFVNVPSARHVAVVDRVKGAVTETWGIGDAEANFPMALDDAGGRLFVGTRLPALLLVYDTHTGQIVAKLETGKDADDIFYDAARKRIYVICGEGRIDVVRQVDPDHYALESTQTTAPRARTGLFVPETRRLYVAAPDAGASPARLLVFKVR
jgi:DNA-binding beta-propeller fold protein YncE